MVIDEIGNASLYSALGPGIGTALRFLAEADLLKFEPGRHELHNGCFALVQDYETALREGKLFEAHRKYLDVQFIVSGVEMIGYAPHPSTGSRCSTDSGCPMGSGGLTTVEEYDEAKDAELLRGEGSFVELRAGMFMILYPQDAHMPGVAAKEPQPVRKVVVKVPTER